MSRGSVCRLPSIMKIMSPFKIKVDQVFIKPMIKKKKSWSFLNFGFLSSDENLLLMHHAPRLLCISRGKANVSEVACPWPKSIMLFANIYETVEGLLLFFIVFAFYIFFQSIVDLQCYICSMCLAWVSGKISCHLQCLGRLEENRHK